MKVNFILLIASLALGSEYYRIVEAEPDTKLYVWAHPNKDEWSDDFLAAHRDWALLQIGSDYDGSDHYVGRAHFQGQLLPGKWEYVQHWWQKIFDTGTYKIWIGYGSMEFELRDFQSLWLHPCAVSHVESTNPLIPWVQDAPDNALIGGFSRSREEIYVGKLEMETDDGLIEVPSKIIRSSRKMYGTYNGLVREGPIDNYITVQRRKECHI